MAAVCCDLFASRGYALLQVEESKWCMYGTGMRLGVIHSDACTVQGGVTACQCQQKENGGLPAARTLAALGAQVRLIGFFFHMSVRLRCVAAVQQATHLLDPRPVSAPAPDSHLHSE